MNKENVHSRAYIAFKNEDLVAEFSREYDGHVFRDKAGALLYLCYGRIVLMRLVKATRRRPSSSLHRFKRYLLLRR